MIIPLFETTRWMGLGLDRQGGTEDKLGMTLDDVIRVQVRGSGETIGAWHPQITLW